MKDNMFSHKLLKRFVKDYSLPIQVIQEPYFNYYIDLYNKQFNTYNKLELLNQAVKSFNSEEEFLEEYYKIRDNIIKTIEATEIYQEYNNNKMDKYDIINKGYSSKDVFKKDNIGKYFMSIDLKKANFQAMKYFNSALVLNCNTYEELIGRFTDLEYMKQSKYLRQVIFGNMNPKRQVKIERYMTEKILNLLMGITTFLESDIKMFNNDEIVLELIEYDTKNIEYVQLINSIKSYLGFDVDVEIYQLHNIGNTKYFVKNFINKSGYELMCIPLVYYSQAYKKYNSIPLEENDLLFFYENQVCKFLKPINFESEEENNEDRED